MKRIVMIGAVLSLLAMGVMLANDQAADEAPPPGAQQNASYAVGLNIGGNLRAGGFDEQLLDMDQLIRGVRDALAGEDPKVSEEEMNAALEWLDDTLRARQVAMAEQNRQRAQQFLAQNQQQPNVQTLPNGLQYRVLESGDGPSPEVTDRVRTHYEGRLIDGTVFDSSLQRGEPAVFPVSGVIRGWMEALQRMQVGDKWQLFVPPEMAYGEQGFPPNIGPNEVLIFEMELLGIEDQQPRP